MLIGIDPDADHLYDEQQRRPVGFCACCLAELYSRRSDLCDRCRERLEGEED